jgi:hypothetical protein
MQTYTCFFLAEDGRISDVLFVECANDGAALHRADGLLRDNPVYRRVEVWQADRQIYGRDDVNRRVAMAAPLHSDRLVRNASLDHR